MPIDFVEGKHRIVHIPFTPLSDAGSKTFENILRSLGENPEQGDTRLRNVEFSLYKDGAKPPSIIEGEPPTLDPESLAKYLVDCREGKIKPFSRMALVAYTKPGDEPFFRSELRDDVHTLSPQSIQTEWSKNTGKDLQQVIAEDRINAGYVHEISVRASSNALQRYFDLFHCKLTEQGNLFGKGRIDLNHSTDNSFDGLMTLVGRPVIYFGAGKVKGGKREFSGITLVVQESVQLRSIPANDSKREEQSDDLNAHLKSVSCSIREWFGKFETDNNKRTLNSIYASTLL